MSSRWLGPPEDVEGVVRVPGSLGHEDALGLADDVSRFEASPELAYEADAFLEGAEDGKQDFAGMVTSPSPPG